MSNYIPMFMVYVVFMPYPHIFHNVPLGYRAFIWVTLTRIHIFIADKISQKLNSTMELFCHGFLQMHQILRYMFKSTPPTLHMYGLKNFVLDLESTLRLWDMAVPNTHNKRAIWEKIWLLKWMVMYVNIHKRMEIHRPPNKKFNL